jgi:hypothetical protein
MNGAQKPTATVRSEATANVVTKAAIKSAGGTSVALAIAMLEDKHLESQPHADYPFGDQLPNGTPKTGDAANFGVFKMNWYMIQMCQSAKTIIGNRPPGFAWQSIGIRINNDVKLATQILTEAMHKWSTAAPNPAKPVAQNFWAGHRWGSDGLNAAPHAKWNDILQYFHAVQTIKQACDGDVSVWTSNIRYYLYVPPV